MTNQRPEDVAREWLLEIFDTKPGAFTPAVCVTEEQSEDLFARLAACQQESPSAAKVFDQFCANNDVNIDTEEWASVLTRDAMRGLRALFTPTTGEQ